MLAALYVVNFSHGKERSVYPSSSLQRINSFSIIRRVRTAGKRFSAQQAHSTIAGYLMPVISLMVRHFEIKKAALPPSLNRLKIPKHFF